MSTHFRPTVISGNNWTYVRIQGAIDEDNRLDALMRDIGTELLVIDLSAVDRINSRGVRDWVNWIADLVKSGIQAYLVQCSSAVVAQLNLVGNFSGKASVCSVSAPYYCEACDFEHTAILSLEDLENSARPQAPVRACPQCKNAMSFDDIEDSFFGFVGAVKQDNSDTVHSILKQVRKTLGEDQWSTTEPGRDVSAIKKAPAETDTYRETLDNTDSAVGKAANANELSRSDMLFYLAVGALSALLLMLVYHVAVP